MHVGKMVSPQLMDSVPAQEFHRGDLTGCRTNSCTEMGEDVGMRLAAGISILESSIVKIIHPGVPS